MKKNLRIVSAAAAALLAVAPVAASATSTVFADTAVSGTVTTGNASTTTRAIRAGINPTNFGAFKTGDSVKGMKANVWSTVGTPDITGAPIRVYKYNEKYTTAADYVEKGTALDNFTDKPDDQYVVVVSNMSITGLDKSAGDYTVNGDATAHGSDNQGNISRLALVSAPFRVGVSAKVGAPYVSLKGISHAETSGEIGLDKGQYSVKGLVDAIEAKYQVKTTVVNTNEHKDAATSDWTDVNADVKAALKNAGITVNADGTFAKPSSSFTVNLGLTATNGNTANFPLTVYPDPLTDGDRTFPHIFFGNDKVGMKGVHNTIDVGNASFNYVPVGQGVNVKGIQDAFTVTVSGSNTNRLTPNVDISKVNTAIAGKYPVTVSATNTDGKTSSVTFFLTVGLKGATYTTVQSDIDVPVYEINGNTVTDTKTVVKNGDQIATFGTVTIDGKSYTRVNSADSTKFVETKYVDGSVKPVAAVAKKVMHNSYIYDKNHKRIGTNVLAAYSTVNVYGPTTKLADGSLVYKIGDNQYVMADNIDGTARVLSHNAYVYKTSKKRADRRVLQKGATVVTYGSPYTFKNGKAYYRIGGPAKQYVKVANFK